MRCYLVATVLSYLLLHCLCNDIVKAEYDKLAQQYAHIFVVSSVSNLLEWDRQVLMPEKAAELRAKQEAVIQGFTHDFRIQPWINESLGIVEKNNYDGLGEYEKANIKLMRDEYDKKIRVPKELIEESSKLTNAAFAAWTEARKTSNFSLFAPHLQKQIDITRKIAQLQNPDKDVYDVLIDDSLPGITSQHVSKMFKALKHELIPFIQKIKEHGRYIDSSFLTSKSKQFSIGKQKELNKKIAHEVVQFSFKHGRIDTSVHPFTIGIDRTDVRSTSRYKDTEFAQALQATLHEAGHALYERQINKKYSDQPVARPLGTDTHESQSLFWERNVGLSEEFWKRYWKVIAEAFPHLEYISWKRAHAAVNKIDFTNAIRVEADELTYPLHIIIRYEIEKDLFSNKIKVEELPEIWNEKMIKYLGFAPKNDAEGVLQDVHWTESFGYFPSYTYGAMYAAQMASVPVVDKYIREGKYKEIAKWLKDNVHRYGSLHITSDELLRKATGEKLNPIYFIRYLKNKFNKLYDLI